MSALEVGASWHQSSLDGGSWGVRRCMPFVTDDARFAALARELVDAAVAEDPAGYRIALGELQPSLQRLAMSIVRRRVRGGTSDCDPQEIADEVVTRLLETPLNRPRPNVAAVATLKSWVQVVTLRLIAERCYRRQRMAALPEEIPDRDSSIETIAMNRELLTELRRCISETSNQQSDEESRLEKAFDQLVKGANGKQIAKKLGVSEDNAYQIIHRLRRVLVECRARLEAVR